MTTSTSHRPLQILAFALGLSLLFACRGGYAQDQEWMVKPTKEHELLKKDVGTWDASVKVWPGKGAQAMESKGTEKNKLLPGGLWLVSRFEGAMAGMPLVGVGTFGYDPVEKKYVGTWVDTMTPHLMITQGEYDEQTKTLTGTAEGHDQQTGKPYKAQLIARYVDDDTRVFELHMPGDNGGDYWKMLEITYERRGE